MDEETKRVLQLLDNGIQQVIELTRARCTDGYQRSNSNEWREMLAVLVDQRCKIMAADAAAYALRHRVHWAREAQA